MVSFVTNRSPLFRLDSASNVVWRQDSLSFHHAINLDAEGQIWACVMQWERGGRHIAYRGRYVMDEKTVRFLDNSIAQIDPDNGHILSVTSCAGILRDNSLEHLILRCASLRQHNHHFLVVLMFREPLTHMASLQAMHRKYCALQ